MTNRMGVTVRSSAKALLASAGVALLTYTCYRLQLDITTTALVDLIAIVLVSLTGNLVPSVAASLVATLSLNYWLVPPAAPFSWDWSLDVVAVLAFLTTALVITHLLSRVRQSLREAERARDELRLAIDTIPALVWTTFPDGSSDFNNQRWLEYTGLSREQAKDWGYTAALHPEDYERLLPEWAAGFRTGEAIVDEARLRRADGEYRWFMHRVVPLRDDRGTIVKWYGTSTDIEDQRRSVDKLREQARLLDLTHDSVFVRDLQDVITYWNRGAEELYGWTSDEVLGQVTHTVLQTVLPLPFEEITATLLETGRWEGELVHTRRDGARVVVASRWSLQRDAEGRPIGTLETNNDITERKRAEEVLRRSEAYLAEAQRLSQTGSWARSLRHPEQGYASAEMYRIFGLDPSATMDFTEELFHDRVHPEDLQGLQEVWQAAVQGKSDFETECRVLRSDGAIRNVYLVGHPVVDGGGEVDELVGTLMDVTERKRADQALRRARERALKVRFEAVLDERIRLAREIHDTLLQGFTGVALKLVAASSRFTASPEAAASLQDVVSLAQKTLVDARQAVWDLRSPSLVGGELVTELRVLAEGAVRGAGLRLEFQVRGTPRPVGPEVQAVAGRVVQEALTNVVKHAAAGTVHVRLSFRDRGLQLSVKDDGRGFAADPNFQGYGGHWGLLGMRERAAGVRGKLRVRSAPGQGTELVLLVPYAIRGESHPVPAGAPPA
jgi:PAS domain S-box-containing protein